MRAWVVRRPGPIGSRPVVPVERAVPEPGPGEVRVRVAACGVCRTDLHLAEGDLPPKRPDVIPGHEIVGRIDALGEGSTRFRLGDRIGIAWLRGTCGKCRFCRRDDENLCTRPRFTGWDDDGGYAEYALAPEAYAYTLPESLGDVETAPLLCAGIIGYRALRRAALPPGGRLGIYGFGASAHLACQVALHEGATVHVMTRSRAARRLARDLGAASAAGPSETPPEPLDAAVLFVPAGEVALLALRALDRGGRLSIAGIHLTDIPSLRYQEHLFYEREIVSVTANTRRDGEEFLELAARIPLAVTTQPFPLGEADEALSALARGELVGAAVLVPE